jgi:hypothetical protein
VGVFLGETMAKTIGMRYSFKDIDVRSLNMKTVHLNRFPRYSILKFGFGK